MKLLLTLIVSFSPIAGAQSSSVDWQPLSHGYTTYLGEDITKLNIYQDGQFLGQESFENRYGIDPNVVETIVTQPLTEPFILAHAKRTRYVFVYLHGITDSAFQGKDLARSLYNAGHDVLVTRLSGHGVDSVNIGQRKDRPDRSTPNSQEHPFVARSLPTWTASSGANECRSKN
jgi:hypothetical protein